jgi:hypothetical protein
MKNGPLSELLSLMPIISLCDPIAYELINHQAR